MENVLINPYWLFGYEVVFNMVLCLITFAISYYSFMVYRLSQSRKSGLFSLAFALFAVAYLIQAVFGFLAVSVTSGILELVYFGTFIHLFFFITATVVLVYLVSDIDRPGLFLLLLLISLIPLIFFKMSLFLEYVIISSLLLYVFLSFLVGCLKKDGGVSFLVPLGFGLLLLSDIHLIFSLHNSIFYVIGNIVEVFAYIFLLANLVSVLTK